MTRTWEKAGATHGNVPVPGGMDLPAPARSRAFWLLSLLGLCLASWGLLILAVLVLIDLI